MKIEVFCYAKGLWFFLIVARNGEILAQSEGYERKGGAMKAIKRLQKGMAAARVVVIP